MVAAVTALPVIALPVAALPVAAAPDSGPIHAALGRLRAAALDLAEACSWSADSADVRAAVVEVPSVGAVVDAALGAVVNAADVRCVAQAAGFRRLDQMVLAESNASGVEVRARLRRINWLRDFAMFADAHACGDLTAAHVEKIRLGLDNPRTRFSLRRDQALLVDAAVTCDFKDFERYCDYWMIAADPDGAEPRDQVSRSRFTARRRADGMVSISGLLDPLSGQTFLTAWDRVVQQMALTDQDNSAAAGQRARGTGKQGVQALLQLVVRGAARANGSQPEPLVHIVMSQRVAEDTLRRLAEPGDLSPLPVDATNVDGRCELINGAPVHPLLVASVLGIAALQRTVMDARGRPLETSYPTRKWPKWLRHLVLLRSRGRCESHGCDAPFPWLQLDHIHPHSRSGATAYANAQAYCRPHNLAKGAGL